MFNVIQVYVLSFSFMHRRVVRGDGRWGRDRGEE